MSKKVLVVDDQPLPRQALCNELLDVGFEVEQAEDGEQGLTWIELIVALEYEYGIDWISSEPTPDAPDQLRQLLRCGAASKGRIEIVKSADEISSKP